MTQSQAHRTLASIRIAALPQILAAALLGFFIVYGVGFSPVSAVHNAAHDVRHGFAFPCH
jgi:cobalt transporter subunit CbtB